MRASCKCRSSLPLPPVRCLQVDFYPPHHVRNRVHRANIRRWSRHDLDPKYAFVSIRPQVRRFQLAHSLAHHGGTRPGMDLDSDCDELISSPTTPFAANPAFRRFCSSQKRRRHQGFMREHRPAATTRKSERAAPPPLSAYELSITETPLIPQRIHPIPRPKKTEDHIPTSTGLVFLYLFPQASPSNKVLQIPRRRCFKISLGWKWNRSSIIFLFLTGSLSPSVSPVNSLLPRVIQIPPKFHGMFSLFSD